MVEQSEDLDQSQSDARGSQSHPSCRLWESQSDVMEVGPRMEGTPMARGRGVAAQGECGKREGRDHCQPGREEKSQTEMVEVSGFWFHNITCFYLLGPVTWTSARVKRER